MATQRHQTLVHNENIGPIANGKNVITRSTRAALGNIGSNIPVQNTQGKSTAIIKPGRPLTKQTGLASLAPKPKVIVPQITKRVTRKQSQEQKKEDEEPMEVIEGDLLKAQPLGYSASTLKLENVENIDEFDAGDPQLLVEYVNDVYGYLRQLEKDQSVKENYLAELPNCTITHKMRSVLIDWLVEVHQQFSLLQETLYLTVSIIDRFLQVAGNTINKKMLQLVGVTAMFIASKYEEMYSPEIRDFVYITDNSYTEAQIRKTELKMLRTLNFELGRPIPLHFLRRNSKAGFVNSQIHVLSKYVLELTLVDYNYSHIPPSMLAAAALGFSMQILDKEAPTLKSAFWTPTLIHYTNYTLKEIAPLIQGMAKLVHRITKAPEDSKLMAVRKKYGSMKLNMISEHKNLTSGVILTLMDKELD